MSEKPKKNKLSASAEQSSEDVVNSDDENGLEEVIPPQMLEAMPPQVKESMMSIMSHGPLPNPISKKVTSEHISSMIGNDEAANQREFEYRKRKQNFNLIYVLIAAFVFFALYLTVGQTDSVLFRQIVTGFITFFAGFAAGWGVNSWKSDDP